MKKSTTSHLDAGLGWFALKTIRKGEVIGYNIGPIVYTNLTKMRRTTKIYKENVVQGTVKIIRKWKNEPMEMVMDKVVIDRKVWKVSALFCAMRYIIVGTCFLGDFTREAERSTEPRENDVQLLHCKFLTSP